MTFISLGDGRLLEEQSDGSWRPIESKTNWAYLDSLTEDEIEVMATSDPDHPGTDDAFWDQADARAAQPATISLEGEVVEFFRRRGPGYEARINAVLRDHIAAQIKRAS